VVKEDAMKIPWDNKRDMQKSHFNQKKYGETTMSYPWINYEEMTIIINKQKAVFTLYATPDFQHINETNTENSDDIYESDTKQGSMDTVEMGGLVEPYRRKKRSKLNKKSICYRKIKNSSDIRKSNTKIKYIDTVEVSDLIEINKRKKKLKLRKKCNRRRKKFLQEPYRIYEAPTPDYVCKIDYPIELNKHAGIHSTTIKIPYSTFSKIHNYLHPCIIDNTISAADPKHYPEIKDDNLVDKYHHHHECDDDCDTDYNNEMCKHARVHTTTIKIPFYAFAKIYNLLHPPSCAIFARNAPKDNLVDGIKGNLGTSQANEMCKHERVHTTTIKIPFYAFAKIYNLLHPPNCAIYSHKHSLKIEHVSKRDKYDDACESSNSHQFHKSSGVRSRAIKIPISTFVDIDNFLHPAIFGSTTQNTFKFIDHSKMLDTITYYHEQPYCHLVGFKSHEIFLLTDPVYQANAKEKDNNKSVVVPLHDPDSVKKRESHNHICPYHESLNIRVPVVVGEYNIEICLEKDVRFEEKVNMVKEISKEVILTNCKFVPADFSNSTADGSREALSGKLFIEGYIHQRIEYNAVDHGNDKFIAKENSFHSLHQKIVVDLMVDLLQVQKITFGQMEI